jgi:hypothetical protein
LIIYFPFAAHVNSDRDVGLKDLQTKILFEDQRALLNGVHLVLELMKVEGDEVKNI